MNSKPEKLLFIEDNPGDARLIRELLAESRSTKFVVEHASKLSDGLEILRKEDIDVVLLDLGLPDSQGLETFTRIHSVFPQTPIVILTGMNDETIGTAAVKEGAQDYLIKGQVDSQLLARSMIYAIERKQAEESLAHLASFPELNPQPIIELDFTGRIMYLNPVATSTFPDFQVSQTADLENPYLTGLKEIISDFEQGKTNEVHRDIPIDTRWFGQTIYFIKEIKRLRIYGRDITETKKADQSLKAEEAKFRNLVTYAPVGISLAKRHSAHLLTANKTWLDMYGYTPEEVPNINTWDLWNDPEDAGRYGKIIDEKGIATNFEALSKRKDGSTFWISISGSALSEEANEDSVTSTVVEDITERKVAQQELKQSLERISNAIGQTIQAMANIAEVRDPYTAGHQRRVEQLSVKIAMEMGLSKEQIDGIRMAAFVHDIGKISIPAEILSKPGQLTPPEIAIIHTHSQTGHDILDAIDFPWPITKFILEHHERYNGSGYPAGLSGEKISQEARIIAVADVMEAMSSHRPYRPTLGVDRALMEILQNSGNLYDPKVVDICFKLFTEKGFKFSF